MLRPAAVTATNAICNLLSPLLSPLYATNETFTPLQRFGNLENGRVSGCRPFSTTGLLYLRKVDTGCQDTEPLNLWLGQPCNNSVIQKGVCRTAHRPQRQLLTNQRPPCRVWIKTSR